MSISIDVDKEIQRLSNEDRLSHHKRQLKTNKDRASSICTGTCFGGATEIIMRNTDGQVSWVQLMPTEVVELIKQLAAGVSLEVELKPRRDFASWRAWRNPEERILPADGHPPYPKLDEASLNIGKEQLSQEKPGLKPKGK